MLMSKGITISTFWYHNVLMNILKSSDLNSMTLRKIKNFDGKDFFYGFFLCMCQISWKFLLYVIILSAVVGITEMW